MSFDTLRKNRQRALNKLKAESEKLNSNKSFGDDRFWKPTVDKAGNGFAIIRFLPAPSDEELPWTQYWDHGFKGPTGRWYFEKSLTTLGQDDPVSKDNTRLWNTGLDSDKELARERKRRLHYVANILVVSDPAQPENDGKVFLYDFGKKIFDKVQDAMSPDEQEMKADPTIVPINPFDMWDGAHFKIRISTGKWRSYDKSEFAAPSAISDDDSELEDIYNRVYSLAEFTDPKTFKSYAELEKKFKEVVGAQGSNLTTAEEVELDETVEANEPASLNASEPASSSDEDDDIMAEFQRMAENG